MSVREQLREIDRTKGVPVSRHWRVRCELCGNKWGVTTPPRDCPTDKQLRCFKCGKTNSEAASGHPGSLRRKRPEAREERG